MYTPIKNWPKHIYLQPGQIDEGEIEIDFEELETEYITWCTERQFNNDERYYHSFVLLELEEKNKQLEQSNRELVEALKLVIKHEGWKQGYSHNIIINVLSKYSAQKGGEDEDRLPK